MKPPTGRTEISGVSTENGTDYNEYADKINPNMALREGS